MKDKKDIALDKKDREKTSEELADEALDAVAGGKPVIISNGIPCPICGKYEGCTCPTTIL